MTRQTINHRRHGLAVVAAGLAAALMPVQPIMPSVWAEENLVIADGPRAGEKWSRDLGLHIVEPIDSLAPDSDTNDVAVMKSAQTGFTVAIQALAGHTIDRDPCNQMIMQPTTSTLGKFVRNKFQPTINQTEVLARKVAPALSRSGEGSTTTSKQYPGGSLSLVIANSSAELQSETIKKQWCDEVDEYPQDLESQGHPTEIAFHRMTSFMATGDWKRLKISTPTVKGESHIEREFLAGDQRRWHVKCRSCGERFVLAFDRRNFHFEDKAPHNAYYSAPCCGEIYEGHDKIALYRTGKWIPTAVSATGKRSYHFDAMSAPLVPWDYVASEYVKAQQSPGGMKAFHNKVLGLPYVVSGDAPDHERLMERRAPDLRRGVIPPRGVVLVAAADVQGNGIYYVVRAFAPDGQNWPVDADFIAGATTDPRAGAFADLREIMLKSWPDSYGGTRRIDMGGVDCGFRTHVVYSFCRDLSGHNIVPIKGDEGWNKTAFGVGVPVDINFNNQRIRKGTVRHAVGTWPLKGEFFADLSLKGMAAGADRDPDRYVHFAGWQDEVYFTQITGEYLATETYRGRQKRFWKEVPGKENHFLDCEIYLRAIHWWLTDRLTEADWRQLCGDRNTPIEVMAPDMFAPEPIRVAAADRPAAQSPQQRNPRGRGWFSKG